MNFHLSFNTTVENHRSNGLHILQLTLIIVISFIINQNDEEEN